MTSIRDEMTGPTLAPPWLCGHNTFAQKYLYCIGLGMDMLLEKQNEGMLAKCPGRGDATLIPLQASDRVLVQGIFEPNDEFAYRMSTAFDTWARAGSRVAAMAQIQGYLTATQSGATQTNRSFVIVGGNTDVSTWDTIWLDTPANDPPAHALVDPANWDWDGQLIPWRNWLILFQNLAPLSGRLGTAASVSSTGGSGASGVTTGFATITGVSHFVGSDVGRFLTISGAASSGNNGTFQIVAVTSGTTIVIANTGAVAPDANNGSLSWSLGEYEYISPAFVIGSPSCVLGTVVCGIDQADTEVVDPIRQLLKTWKSAGTYYPNIIISFNGGDGDTPYDFSSSNPSGTRNPDGTWGGIGKNVSGVWVPSKNGVNVFTAFCDGTAISRNCYEQNVD